MKQLLVALVAFFAMIGSASAQVDQNQMRSDMISPVVRIMYHTDDDSQDDDTARIRSGFTPGPLNPSDPIGPKKSATITGSGTIIYSGQLKGQGRVYTLVLTNYHVVKDAVSKNHKQVDVDRFTYNANGVLIATTSINAHVMAFDKDVDLALVLLADDTNKFPTATVTKDDTVNVFDKVFAVGSGLGQPTFATEGIISQTDNEIEGHRYIQASAPIIMGNSGGALFRFEAASGHYELIGVPTAVAVYGLGSADPNMGWSIPAATVREFLKEVNLGFIVE